jgi:hypothetical protein
MNAKHLTLICSASALLLANYLLLPAWAKHKSLRFEVARQGQAAQLMQERMSLAQSLPSRVMQLSEPATALSSAVNAWTGASRDYGLLLTQIATPSAAMGQTVVDVSSLGEIDALTRLPVQRLSLKGQYKSLTDFRRFVAQEMNAEQAVAIEQLKLSGDAFELIVAIYSRAL